MSICDDCLHKMKCGHRCTKLRGHRNFENAEHKCLECAVTK